MQKKVYLDNAATTPLCESFLANIQEYAALYYNASSANESSLMIKQEIEKCRQKIAKLINCEPEEIYFTSGASEANSWAIDGFLKAQNNEYYRVIATNIEHSSIMNNQNVSEFIKCDQYGQVRPEQFECYDNCLFCIGLANNEIGTIQPIAKISEVIHKTNGNYLFVDATQALTKVNIDVKKMGIDMMSASGHKIGALKGIGFLYINKNMSISPIIYGSQENSLRGGTYNYLGIKSLSVALSKVKQPYKVAALRGHLANMLIRLPANIMINGHRVNRLPDNLNICIKNMSIDAQQLVALLDMNGFVVSAGSACHAGDSKPSHVLKAIGLSDTDASCSIRITLGEQNTREEIDAFIECLKNIIDMHKSA